jgi:hypothetical protein
MECSICYEKFNKVKHKCIKCPYCPETEAGFCRACVQTYLLQDSSKDPRCPSCHSGWSEDFLSTELTATFLLKNYKEHRENVLLDMERARLPEAQEDAARYKKAKDLIAVVQPQIQAIEEQINHLPENKEYNECRAQFYAISRRYPFDREEYFRKSEELSAVYDKLKSVSGPYKKRIRALTTRDYAIANATKGTFGRQRETQARTQTERAQNNWTFVMRCSKPDCQGFVGMNWVCGLCDQKYCKDCCDPVDADTGVGAGSAHVCDPEKRLSSEALRKEAKPCPKCAAMISKIDGCDQMWCTQCNTAFSWRTGQVENTHIHNPHYFEWMRRNGRTAAPPPQVNGECLQANEVINQVMYYRRTHTDILKWCRSLRHFEWVTRAHQHALTAKQNDEWRRVLRVRRLTNEITDGDWKVKLQKGDKSVQKEHRVVQVLEMFTQAGIDLLRTVLPDDANVEETLKQLEELMSYANNELTKIGKRYKNEVPFLSLNH